MAASISLVILLLQSKHQGNPAIFGSFKVSIKLQTHFCVNKTADLSVIWNLFFVQKTAGPKQFYGHFSNRVDQNHKTCKPLRFLWTLFGFQNSLSSVVSIKPLDLGSSMDTQKKLVDLGSSMDTFPTQQEKSSKNCRPQFYIHFWVVSWSSAH